MRASLATAGLVVILFAAESLAADVTREPLDHLWDDHMLQGTGGHYVYRNAQPQRVDMPPPWPFEKERRGKGAGSVFAMDSTEYGIGVQNLRETRLLGLLQGGGWKLTGGLLERIEVGAAMVELWGKVVDRVYPGLWDNYYRPKEETTYEFFLVQRPTRGEQGTVLRKWTIRPDQVRWFVPEHILKGPPQPTEEILRRNETSNVRAYVRYEPASKTAIVTITGLKALFEERVDLSGSR